MAMSLADYEQKALEVLDPSISAYIQAVSGTGKTQQSNLKAYSQYKLVPRVLEKIETLSTTVTLLGQEFSSPFMVAPTAWHKMFCDDGEMATLKATRKAGSPYIISSFSSMSFQDLQNDKSGDLSHVWYQTLLYRDKDLHKKYIARAEEAGCSAIVLTVDALLGCSMCKTDDSQSALKKPIFPLDMSPLLPVSKQHPFQSLDEYYDLYLNPAQSWTDIEDIVKFTKLPVILKGILHPEDAARAVDVGVKAIIVSNHGGRQLDDTISTLGALELITRDHHALEIYLDGGIRSGADAFKALALGAKAVLIGRPALYGLSVDGEKGLVSVLQILRQELEYVMMRTGCDDLNAIRRDRLFALP